MARVFIFGATGSLGRSVLRQAVSQAMTSLCSCVIRPSCHPRCRPASVFGVVTYCNREPTQLRTWCEVIRSC